MSGTWKEKVGDCEISIDTGALSAVLNATCGPSIATLGAMTANTARNGAPPSDRDYIFLKNTQEFDLKSGKLPKLSRMLSVPVALVVNNSAHAEAMEYGTSRTNPRRPLGRAFDAMRGACSYAVRGR